MEWPPCPSPTEGPMWGFGGAPRPHAGPHCSRPRRPAFGLWLSFTALAPFGEPLPPPRLPPSPSFSSSSWAWQVG